MKDKIVENLISKERERQNSVLRMIASENIVSEDVLEALGSVFTNKYSEGYPGKRYYQGQSNTDLLENLAIERAKKAFNIPGDWHVNVQPYSGSPCNQACYLAFCSPGDKVIGLGLQSGGHLTHGSGVNFSGRQYEIHRFDVDKESELIDYDKLDSFVKEVDPRMLIIGTTAYSRIIDWKRIREICDKYGCFYIADIAHVAGLVASGVYPSPIPYADVVTMTTHKTLRGPRGGMIFCRDVYSSIIDKAVFPGLQGGPHMNQIAALAVALEECSSPEYKEYASQIVKNAKELSKELQNLGYRVVSDGTDCHLLVVDVRCRNITGKQAAIALEKAGIECNFNTIPYDPNPPIRSSGIRLGLSSLTTRGFKEEEMNTVASYIDEALRSHNNEDNLKIIAEDIRLWLSNYSFEH